MTKKCLGRISGRLHFLAQVIGLRPRLLKQLPSKKEGYNVFWMSANRNKTTNQGFFLKIYNFFLVYVYPFL